MSLLMTLSAVAVFVSVATGLFHGEFGATLWIW